MHARPRHILSIVSAGLVASGVLAIAAPAAADADGCPDGTVTDFNGDGRDDTVVADSLATVNGQAEAGRVIVLYGDADGRVGEGARGVITQGAGSVGGTIEAGDRFGYSTAGADLDCDGFTDLVVGVPNEDIGGRANSGYVQVIWGSAAGLGSGDASVQYTQAAFGLTAGDGDQLGWAVDAFEDAGQGGTPAPDAFVIGIGVPGAAVGGDDDAGWVGFVAATDGGSLPMWASQDTPGVPGAAEPGDRFGASLTLSHLVEGPWSPAVDAVVGAPGEDLGALANAGDVTVLIDVYDEIVSGLRFDQNSAGVGSTAEAGDGFGTTVDSISAGGVTNLAVGAPGEDVGSLNSAGLVQLFTSNEVTITPGAALTQDTAGVSGTAEAGDRFGDALAFAPTGPGNVTRRLAVAAPTEDGAAADTGAVWIFPLNDLDAETTYTQDSVGMPGLAEAGDRFGRRLAVANGVGETILMIGVPDDVARPTGMVDVLPFGGAVKRYWAPGVGGVPSGGAVRFGDALASTADS